MLGGKLGGVHEYRAKVSFGGFCPIILESCILYGFLRQPRNSLRSEWGAQVALKFTPKSLLRKDWKRAGR